MHGCEVQAVGMDAAKMAAQNMQMLLPGGAQASALPAHPDTVTSIIAGMSRPELYAIISQAAISPSLPSPLPVPITNMSRSEQYAIIFRVMPSSLPACPIRWHVSARAPRHHLPGNTFPFLAITPACSKRQHIRV